MFRAKKPKEDIGPWLMWVEFWKTESGEWRPVPKDAKVPWWRDTHWGKYYTKMYIEALKITTPFMQMCIEKDLEKYASKK